MSCYMFAFRVIYCWWKGIDLWNEVNQLNKIKIIIMKKKKKTIQCLYNLVVLCMRVNVVSKQTGQILRIYIFFSECVIVVPCTRTNTDTDTPYRNRKKHTNRYTQSKSVQWNWNYILYTWFVSGCSSFAREYLA